MKKGVLYLVIFDFLSSGCMVVDKAVSKVSGEIGARVSKRMLGGMELEMQKVYFQMVYAQVFYLGGFGYGYSEFKVGDDTTWRVETKDSGGTSWFEAQRNYIKKLPDGTQWWYVRLKSEDDEFGYAALVDADFGVRKVRYLDPDTKEIMEFEYEEPTPEERERVAKEGAKDGPDVEAKGEGEFIFPEGENYSRYVTAREKLTVPAGSFDTEKIVYDYRNPETQEDYNYIWWVSRQVPGGLVRYTWENRKEQSSLQGNLIKVGRSLSHPLVP